MERADSAEESRRSGSDANRGLGEHRADLPALLAEPFESVEHTPRSIRRDGKQETTRRLGLREKRDEISGNGCVDRQVGAEGRVDVTAIALHSAAELPGLGQLAGSRKNRK